MDKLAPNLRKSEQARRAVQARWGRRVLLAGFVGIVAGSLRNWLVGSVGQSYDSLAERLNSPAGPKPSAERDARLQLLAATFQPRGNLAYSAGQRNTREL